MEGCIRVGLCILGMCLGWWLAWKSYRDGKAAGYYAAMKAMYSDEMGDEDEDEGDEE